MEHVPPQIRKLVCENCWRTVFTFDAFCKAWADQTACSPDDYSCIKGFSYPMPTWKQIQRQQRRHLIKFQYECQWCKIVCLVISRLRPDIINSRNQDDPAARFIDQRPVLLDIDSHTTYSLIKKCLDDCLLHECCPKPSYAPLPTRVIDCKDPDHPCLFVSDGIKDHYVALSYVWGAAFKDLPHCTTTRNLQSYINEIPLDNIPKTIMDAITVTQKLGVQYLWVDSLCILQDSKEDKATQISMMLNIFHNAYVTIIAACAERVSDGFLHARTEMETMSLPFLCPDGDIGIMKLQVDDMDAMEYSETRAWCVEEWVLSPRKLIYATWTVQYECQAIHTNVNGSCTFIMPSVSIQGIPHLPHLTKSVTPHYDGNQPVDNDLITKTAWKDILYLYTQGAATKPRDRLIALSGIAKHFQSLWPCQRYMAGIWDHQPPNDLLWSFEEQVPQLRPDSYRAPSWSWASIDTPIKQYIWPDDRFLCNVIQWNVSVKQQDNPYGEVEGGYLILDAILQPAVWDPVKGNLCDAESIPTDYPNSVKLELDKNGEYQRQIIGHVWRDALEPVSQVTGKVYLVLGCQDDNDQLNGLVLVPVTNQTTNIQQYDHLDYPIYRRVGFFMTYVVTDMGAMFEEWMNSPHQLVKII
ncbi:HET-domain-containing protein [Armillaria gallica]|uniref:HET-domain-containing protein n=1 Tax=Armillaria gallica TaxID=47427 RepID=A0A2H3EM35_ARMGA|nr:HET-domain-containing protein [Armillaria gallica]